ncbi:MAG: UbiD family decarboxylase [Deltaproteobacteria bacterium]|nr:UbiD family decarboxylase [Deltaproteobacteria bacterium]
MNQVAAEKMESRSSRSMAQTPHGSSTDLRSWLRAVAQMGEIRPVEGADWNLELGAIAELNTRLKPTPALLFDKIKDYPAGYRVLTASTASRRRLLLTLRMPTDLDDCAFAEALVGKPNQWEQESSRFNPTFVTNGPILENVIDSNINLESFPAPIWHVDDGGRCGDHCGYRFRLDQHRRLSHDDPRRTGSIRRHYHGETWADALREMVEARRSLSDSGVARA